MDNYYKEKLALDEVRKQADLKFKTGDILDNKAMNVLSSSSLILTLFSVLQISLVEVPQPILYKIGVGIVFVFYLALVIAVLSVVRPRIYRTAFKPTWEGVKKSILNLEMPDVTYQMIGNYLDRIEGNGLINAKKVRGLKISIYLFVAIMLLLLVLSLFIAR